MARMTASAHPEHHLIDRVGWLRAGVLGANDGLLSTASLIVGVASANPDHAQVLLAGIAGLAAGSMSMAACEYVSVSSQSDTEEADIAREKTELRQHPQAELKELADIYVHRGLAPDLEVQVATTHGERCTGCAHPRRVTSRRNNFRASGAGGDNISRLIRSRGCVATPRGFAGTGAIYCPGSDRSVTGIAGSSRCARRLRSAPALAARTYGAASRASCSGMRWRWQLQPVSGTYSEQLCKVRLV